MGAFDVAASFGPFGPGTAGPGAAPMVQPTIRTKFADTALWVGQLTTESDGTAEVELNMPENLTTWRIKAWGMGFGTRVGQGQTDVVTRKDLIIRLEAPRFFVQTDEVVLSAIVHNYLKTTKKVEVSLELEGKTLELIAEGNKLSPKPGHPVRLNVGSMYNPPVEVPAGGEARVDWRVKVLDEGQATVRMKALTDEESDAMEQKFPCYIHGALKMEARSGMIRGTPLPRGEGQAHSSPLPPGEGQGVRAVGGEARAGQPGSPHPNPLPGGEGTNRPHPNPLPGGEGTNRPHPNPLPEGEGTMSFDVPEKRRPKQSRLEVRWSPTLAGAMVDALPYLVDYPYGCTEQTLNRFLPTVITQKVLLDMKLNLAEIRHPRVPGGPTSTPRKSATTPSGRSNGSVTTATRCSTRTRSAAWSRTASTGSPRCSFPTAAGAGSPVSASIPRPIPRPWWSTACKWPGTTTWPSCPACWNGASSGSAAARTSRCNC